MNKLVKFLVSIPKPATAVGAGVGTAAVVNVIVGLLNGWSWWAHSATQFQTAVSTILIYVLGSLAAWISIVRSKGQTQTLTLTSSPLPTLQQEAPPS